MRELIPMDAGQIGTDAQELEFVRPCVHGGTPIIERTRHRRGGSQQCKTDQEGTEQRQGPMFAG